MGNEQIQKVVIESVTEFSEQIANEMAVENLQQKILNAAEMLTVRIGKTALSYQDIFMLKAGQTLKLDEAVDDPVAIFCGEQCIATVELVVVDDHFGVRIIEVLNS